MFAACPNISKICCHLLLSAILFISNMCVPGLAGAAEELRLVLEEDGVMLYERSGNSFFEQYQLHGHLELDNVRPDTLQFMFTGNVKLRITGSQWAAHPRESRILTWDVTGMPVIIKKWDDKDYFRWGSKPLTFSKASQVAEKISKDKIKMKAAIKLARFTFTEVGDLFFIEGEQIIFKKAKE